MNTPIKDQIDALKDLDVLNMEPEAIEKALEFLDPVYITLKHLLSRFNLAAVSSLLSDMESLVEQLEDIREWQSVLEHYDDKIAFINAHLNNLKIKLDDEIENKKLETMFEISDATAGMKQTDLKKFALYRCRDLVARMREVEKQLMVWDSIRQQFRKKATDLKNHVTTIKSLIHSHELRPEIFYNRKARETQSKEAASQGIDRVVGKYLLDSPVDGINKEIKSEKEGVHPTEDNDNQKTALDVFDQFEKKSQKLIGEMPKETNQET